MMRRGRSPRECSGTDAQLTLRFRPIWPASTRLEAIMPRKVEKSAVVDDKTIRVLPDNRGLHAVVENLARHTADRLERGDVAAQHRLQILVDDEPRPDQTRIAEHHGEQPDDARHPWLIGELNFEPGEIDLGLLAGWGLERTSKGVMGSGRMSRTARFTAV